MTSLKLCTAGRHLLPADDIHFYRDSGDSRKYRGVCKECWKLANAARYAKNPGKHCRNTSEDRRNRMDRQRLMATLGDVA